MAFLVMGGITVPVAPDGVDVRYSVIGDTASRAFDGTMRSTERATKRAWAIRTAPMLPTDAAALVTGMGSGQAIAPTGDMFENGGAAVTCFRVLESRRVVPVRGGFRVVLSFTLHEA